MKKIISVMLILAMTGSSQLVIAQGMPVIDIASLIQAMISYLVAADAYAQQGLQYEKEIEQYETMVKNLEQNPLGPVLPNFQLLVSNAIKIQQQGISIANGMNQVSTNLQKAFKTPQPNFGMQFSLWTQANQNAVQAAMLNAGIQRDNLQPNGADAQQLQALVTKNMASGGALAALQTLGEFSAIQVSESQKLRDLISSELIAANTARMQRSSMDQNIQTANDTLTAPDLTPIPSVNGGAKMPVPTWNLYTPK